MTNVRRPSRLLLATATLAAAAALAACSQGGAADAAPSRPATAASHGSTGTLPRLVFFMNPNGLPCQAQDRILREMGAELTGRAEVVYYRTTEPTEIQRFQEYGIRSLPQILVTDASGRELRRATPGIHSMPDVVQLLTF